MLTVIYGLKHGGHAAPLLVLVVGILIALLLPTPPQYYREPRIFQTHRKEYEALVDLARKGQLQHSADCVYDRTFVAPANYAKLSTYCIKVDREPFFSTQFAPIIYDKNIVYTDDPARIKEVFGCNFGAESLIQQLDTNWFYCWDRR